MTEPGFSRGPLSTVIMLLLLALPGAAQEPTQEREHVVRRGDTLWDLAGTYLDNPFLWPMIYEANRSVVEDPHWIYPGERLRIPGLAGAAAPGVLGVSVTQQAEQAVVAEVADTAAAATTTVDLRRPLMAEAEYYSTPWLARSVETGLVGRVARVAGEPSMAADKIPPTLHPHYQVHVTELRQPASAVGDSLVIVRLGRVVTGYGQVVEPLALLRVDSVAATFVTATVVAQFADARVGDYVLRLERMPEIPRGRAEPVVNGAQGSLLEFLTERALYGTGDHGFVTVGTEALRLGDELAVYVPAVRKGTDRSELPATEVARARVVRLTDGAATVRLTGVFDTSVRAGLPVRLVARMP